VTDWTEGDKLITSIAQYVDKPAANHAMK